MPRLKFKVPSYCRHKASGQAVVTFHGRDVYLGPYGSPESQQKYQQLIQRWVASQDQPVVSILDQPIVAGDLRIGELLVVYLAHADQYYRKNGEPTGEAQNIREAVRPLRELHEDTRVADFGPTALKTVRQAMVEEGLSRKVVNARVGRIRRVFKWGVENELVQPSVLQALQAVAALKKGRTTAPERSRVQPVALTDVDAVLALVSKPVKAMIELQSLTGMRPGEVVIMRPRDIEHAGRIWTYRPASHKTEHHDLDRSISLGPRAQAILTPFLDRDLEDYLFSPREARLQWRMKRRQASKNWRLRNRPVRMKVHSKIGTRYTRKAYHNAIYKACRKAGITPWGPNRLRHNAATLLRKEYGLEAARVILGHRSAEITEVYAEMDRKRADSIMAEIG